MLLFYEILTIFFLLVGTLTGILAFSSLREREKNYSIFNIFKHSDEIHRNPNIYKFLIFFTIVISTFSCLMAAFLRTMWLKDMGWESSGSEWGYWWLTSHSLDGLTFSAVHILIYLRQQRVYS